MVLLKVKVGLNNTRVASDSIKCKAIISRKTGNESNIMGIKFRGKQQDIKYSITTNITLRILVLLLVW